jgi:hypothetical protein
MGSLRAFLIPVLTGGLIVPATAAQHARPAPPPRVQKQAPQPRPPQKGRANVQNGQAKQADNRQGEQLFDELSRMKAEDREKALSQLPPAQSARIKQRLQNFDRLPPAAQNRRRNQLELLNSLPPQRRNQVRESMKDLQQLPQDRKAAVQQEMRHMTSMPDDERQAYMNSEEFRNRYSPSEQEIISNLAAVLPSAKE